MAACQPWSRNRAMERPGRAEERAILPRWDELEYKNGRLTEATDG